MEWDAVLERLTRLEKLLTELDTASTSPDAVELVSPWLTGRELWKCVSVSRKWRRVVSAPGTWVRICKERRLTGEAASAGAMEFSGYIEGCCGRELQKIEAAKRALASAPGAAFVDLRDGLAASARGAAPPPSHSVGLVLDACCAILGRSFKSGSRAWRAALDGTKPLASANGVRCGKKDPKSQGELKLVAALRKFDLVGIFLSGEKRPTLEIFRSIVSDDLFPLPSDAGERNLLVGRLCAFCHAAGTLYDALLEEEGRYFHDAPSTADAVLCADLADAYARKFIAQLKTTTPAPSLRQRTFGVTSSSRRRRGSSAKPTSQRQTASAPPSPATLYDIFVDEKRFALAPTPNHVGAKYYRDVLRQFYEKHNPSLASKADAIAKEWRGRESTLFALLRYKYADKARATTYAPPTAPTGVNLRLTTCTPPSVDDDDRVSIASADGYTVTQKKRRPIPVAPTSVRRNRASTMGLQEDDDTVKKSRRTSTTTTTSERLLRSEIEKLKSDVEAAQKAREQAKAKACAAQRDARDARRLRDQDRQKAAELRAESAALRAERDQRGDELRRLKLQLETESETSPATTPPKPSPSESPPPESIDESLDDLAVAAVESAVCDVLLTEASIEIDFELSFGLGLPTASYRGPSPIKEETDDDCGFDLRALHMPLVV